MVASQDVGSSPLAGLKRLAVVALSSLLLASLLSSASGQRQYQESRQQVESSQQQPGGERVDKLSSLAGDLYWRGGPPSQQQQLELLQELRRAQLEAAQEAGDQVMARLYAADSWPVGQFVAAAGAGDLVDGLPPTSTAYLDLINSFKQQHWNPSREGRAFKPKLMSTARGFGKRNDQQQQQQRLASLANLLASNRGPKMGNQAISSKHFEWINQILLRQGDSSNPLSKHINDKFTDYNG